MPTSASGFSRSRSRPRLGHWCFGGWDARARDFDWNRCYMYQERGLKKAMGSQVAEESSELLGAPWHAWDELQRRWLPSELQLSDVELRGPEQRTALALAQLAELRSWAERRRPGWWRPPQPPEPPGRSEEDMARMATGAEIHGFAMALPWLSMVSAFERGD